jgi:hypothetical protein
MELTTEQVYTVNDDLRALLDKLHLLPKDNDEQDAILDLLVMEFADSLDRALGVGK